ncbi:MAG TPA: pyridoxamine 5'-phosphate oxidase family protein [Candidatus Ozemobacteraceae bacterium]|nr:pyridoxamine 5'-phosphate oxidase family protein [Candidatus Ozemobacteraceae bacterium]
MTVKSETLKTAWEKRDGPLVLATVDSNGTPNAVYVMSVKLLSDGRIAIADNKFHKTRGNIKNGSRGALLFMAKDHTAYQAKGTIEYVTSGKIYDDMLTWVDARYARVAVAVLHIEHLYSGAEELA